MDRRECAQHRASFPGRDRREMCEALPALLRALICEHTTAAECGSVALTLNLVEMFDLISLASFARGRTSSAVRVPHLTAFLLTARRSRESAARLKFPRQMDWIER